MTDNASFRDTFFEECEELLEALSEGLSLIQEGAHDSESVNAVFRAVHSVKGGAGAFGLDELVGFAHTFESVLDYLRSGKLTFDPPLLDLLLRSSDSLAELVEAARDGAETDCATRKTIVEQLEAYLDDDDKEDVEVEFEALALDFEMEIPEVVPDQLQIRLRPHKTLYQNGHEPLFLLQALNELGEMSVELAAEDLPDVTEFDPTDAYLSWVISLETTAPRSSIDEIFEFVEGLCDVEIQTSSEDPEPEPEEPVVVELRPAPEDPAPAPPPTTAAPEAPRAASTPKPTLRVDLDRVDRLINTVGELIINQAMLTQQIAELDHQGPREIESQLQDYRTLARDLQEGVMAIRAQPVKPLFQRMARIVRESSAATSKSAKLVMVGESTEVDKTVIERLTDPLTHMIRNAVDHGLEKPETRVENGKSEVGEIRLSASHRSGSVYIEITDDGAGLNRSKIRSIAVEKGLISADAELTDTEIDHLLFLPGFSTASEISNLSGRGVGMDVVKNAVTALGGRVSISTRPGQGTTFSVVLPLTLAVMDGMVILVANQTMVVPIASILETIRPNPDAINQLGPEGALLSIRGKFVPIYDLADALDVASQVGDPSGKKTFLLVDTESMGQCALAVDAILDQRQVVIKSLHGVCGKVPGVSAATILGDGQIAMILDPDEIVKTAQTVKISA